MSDWVARHCVRVHAPHARMVGNRMSGRQHDIMHPSLAAWCRRHWQGRDKMRVKDQTQNRVSRVLREMYARHAMQCRKWERQAVSATKCRYRGYFALAVIIAYGHYVDACTYMPHRRMWRVELGDECSGHALARAKADRRAKKLARRIRGMWQYVDARPWRCA